MNRSIAAAILIATFLGVDANAGDLQLELVAATKLPEQLRQAREACETREGTAVDIEQIASSNPLMFYGIDSKSSGWSDVRAAYIRYAVSTCVPQSIDEYSALAASVYGEDLSEDELKAVTRFYETDAGKKFALASARLSAELNEKMYKESQMAVERGGIRFDAEAREIATKLESSQSR